jgi:hypothetical protein
VSDAAYKPPGETGSAVGAHNNQIHLVTLGVIQYAFGCCHAGL